MRIINQMYIDMHIHFYYGLHQLRIFNFRYHYHLIFVYLVFFYFLLHFNIILLLRLLHKITIYLQNCNFFEKVIC